MFTCKIKNEKNNIFTLTQIESNFQVISITGLNPPNAQINRSTVVGIDGSKYNSSKLEERNIVITLKINGDVEANRLFLYRFFPTKEWCQFYYKNNSRDVYIEGYVETVECDLFTSDEYMQISIICPDPYFKALNTIVNDISKSLSAFKFPFSINVDEPIPFSTINLERITTVDNESETKTGLIITANFSNAVSKLEIKNTVTGENLIINYNFIEDDILTINTNKGNKSITLIRNNTEYNLIPYLKKGSTFFQLDLGDNNFSYLADNGNSDENVNIIFTHNTIYRGV